jgi:glycosyltransferase involved in cell wall biosynthesis
MLVLFMHSNNSYLVSVIIPFFNRSQIVSNCLRNVKNQTYKNVEIIAIDDCSTEIYDCSIFKANNTKLIKLDKNRGPGYARKIGRENASGEFIVYLDSDDWWCPNFLSECVAVLTENPECGMVYTNTVQLKDGIALDERIKGECPNKILPSLFKRRCWSTSSSVWRKEVSLPEFWKPYRDHEDYLHEVLCASINNETRYVSGATTYKNANTSNQTKYHNHDLESSLIAIVKHTKTDMTKGLFAFTVNKISLRTKVNYKCVKILLLAAQREKNKLFERVILIFFLNILYTLKIDNFRYRIINNLRKD